MTTSQRFGCVVGGLIVIGVCLAKGIPYRMSPHDDRGAMIGSFVVLALFAAVGWVWSWSAFKGESSGRIFAAGVASAFFLICEAGILAVIDGLMEWDGIY